MSEKIKILMVTGSLHIGGMENVAMNIARYIDKEQFQINFVVYGEEIGEYEAEVKALGGEVYHIPFPRQGASKYCKELRKVLESTGPYDVVHSHNLFPSGMVMRVAYKANVPIRIAHAHTNRDDSHLNIVRRWYQRIMRELMWKYCTQLFACSNKAGEYLFKDKFSREGFVMNNGVDIEKFSIDETTKKNLRNELGISTERIIGHTGRFVEVKNHSLLVDIFKSIYDSGENVKLMLIGDGPLKGSIEEKVRKLGLEDRVIFTGVRNDVPSLLSLMDVYVLPSTYEGVSVSLMEAQAAGIPFVVSESAYSAESRVTEYGTVLDLDSSIKVWKNAIIEQMNRGKLRNAAQVIIDKGYDTNSIIKYVQNKYYKSKEN
jgi:glycosyltransferase involved in cell wall biosynthesis